MQQEKQRNPQRQLVWNNVSYILNKGVPATEKYILNKVSGTATGGEVIAIMGPSGAGKSSLLNCLSGRISVGEIGGHITLNGQPRDLKTWKKQVSFVEQDDIMFSFLSVKETILTAAKLRLNSSKFSKEEKERKADDIIRSLRLSSVSNTMIGSAAVRGVSGGERKRVAIGVELVTDPDILFLDEPTSGLDSNSAYSVLSNVKSEAEKTGRIVVLTVHQPSLEMMSLFSKIILLAPGGYMTYYGDWENAITYFTSLGYDCPLRKNPADWFLDLLTLADSASEDNADGTNDYQVSVKRIKHLTESYAKYDASLSKLGQGSRPSLKQQESASTANDLEAAAATAAVESISNDNKILSSIEVTASSSPLTKRPLSKKNASSLSDIDTGFANSWIVEFGILFGRSFTDLCRNATYWKASVFRVVILCIIMGFAYFRMGLDQFGIQDRAGVLYFWPVNQIFNTINPIVATLPLQRNILMRERAARSYRVSAFFVAKSVAETIPVVFFSLLSATILYFMFGLQLVASKFFIWELVQTLLVYAALSVGLLIGSSVKDVVVGQIMAPLVGVVFLLFGGNLLNSKAIGGWFIWIQWLSPVNWAYRANMINEFNGLDDFSCPDPTLPCFKNGQQVLASQGIDNYGLWWCCLALVVISLVFQFLAYLALRSRSRPVIKL